MKRFIRFTALGDTAILVHWSVLAVGAVLILAAVPNPLPAICAVISYFAVLLIHESGHVLMARRFGCRVLGVELYPIHGVTRLYPPDTPFARSMIAWGGVIAQVVVAMPLVGWMIVLGFTPFEPVNAILVVLGGYNFIIACFNLLPIRPLDGVDAWRLLPILARALWAKPQPSRDEKRRRTRSKLRLM